MWLFELWLSDGPEKEGYSAPVSGRANERHRDTGHMREENLRSPMSSTAKQGSEDEGVMGTASLEVLCAAGLPGPTQYECVFTRGGW